MKCLGPIDRSMHILIIERRQEYKGVLLGTWRPSQRRHRIKWSNSLTQDKINKLDAFGFDWNSLETDWEYFGAWIETQGKQCAKNKIDKNWLLKLIEIDVDFEKKGKK